MKASILFCSLLFAVSGFAEEPPKWALMQRAVLVEHDLDKIRALVTSGVDPNAPIGCGTYAPLDGAILQDNAAMVALLLSLGAKPTDTQMVRAVAEIHPESMQIVKMLVAAGASVNARDYYSKAEDRFTNPIHRAVSMGNQEMIAYLLSQKGIELNHPDVDGYTPLMRAVARGDQTVVDMLLPAGADPRQRNKDGLDAAAVAAKVIKQQQAFLTELKQAPEVARSR